MPGGELKLEPVLNRPRRGNRVLRDDTAVPFHFHLEIIARQDWATEVEDVSETAGVKTMLKIIRDVSLQNARFALAKGAAAIDKLLRDVSDLREVEMGRDELAVGQDETRKGSGMGQENGFEFVQFHKLHLYACKGM